MIGRDYLLRQAMTLLRMSKATNDPQVSAAIAAKAADLKSRIDQVPLPDVSPKAPDVCAQVDSPAKSDVLGSFVSPSGTR